MSDGRLRTLEREARTGDPEAARRHAVELIRAGGRDPRHDPEPGDKVRAPVCSARRSPLMREVVPVSQPVRLSAAGLDPRQCVDYAADYVVDPDDPPSGHVLSRNHNNEGGARNQRLHWVRHEGLSPRSGCCFLSSWRAWAKGAEVLVIAPEAE